MVCNTLGIADGDATATPFVDLDPMDADLYPHKFVAALVGVGAVQGTSPRSSRLGARSAGVRS